MPKRYDYIVFDIQDPYELPLGVFSSIEDVAIYTNNHISTIRRLFSTNNNIHLGYTLKYGIERVVATFE